MTQTTGHSLSAAWAALVSHFSPSHGAAQPQAEKDLAVEEWFAHAADHLDLQQMEQDWSRRDGGGMRAW